MAYLFDRDAGQFVCDFVERLPTTDTGRPFQLYDWQRDALMEFYGTMDVPELDTAAANTIDVPESGTAAAN